MTTERQRFYASAGKRLVLIADDEAINRELLGFIIEQDYEIIYAENGREALGLIRDNAHRLSLILLDLMMPVMDGFELMEVLRHDEALRRIPVIVLTAEKAAEVKSLRLGAVDFITKPYDMPEVILARCQRTIELAEDKVILQNTERNELTGLYNKEFFFRYAEQFDHHHPEGAMDAISIDINHFRLVNELYGWSYGDSILRGLGQRLRSLVEELGGIAGHRDADMFLLYLPHQKNYRDIRTRLVDGLIDERGGGTLRLRIGVYPEVDHALQIERRFDRAKQACDMVRGSYTSFVSVYDNSLHEKEFLAERLINEMDAALDERQFKVFYQPKYNITGEKPLLTSSEALIRWQHPQLGMISPGIFIPLFERNGLIQKLDRYVWEEAARQIAEWRDTYGCYINVSVNVSRNDLYSPDFISTFQDLMKKYDLDAEHYFLEITESAYTEDSKQLIGIVNELRRQGFQVEMDDFGSGYSSLGLLTELPIDALKLDMSFIRNMHADRKNIRVIELMIDIAKYLGVPVIAEGVENEAQMLTLKELGCDLVQGYYFSKPVPPEDFAKFIEERIQENAYA